MPELILVLIGAAGLAAVPASLFLWVLFLVRRRQGRPLLPAVPRRPVPWGLAEVVVTLGVFFVAQNVVVYAGVSGGWLTLPTTEEAPAEAGEAPAEEDGARRLVGQMVVMAASELLTLAVVMGLMIAWAGVRPAQLGLSARSLGRDIAIGLAAAVMLMPPVMLLQAAATQLLPYEHPVLEMLGERSTAAVATAFLAAVVVGPFAEEFFFRVLLQGWLQRVGIRWRMQRAAPEAGDTAEAQRGGAQGANASETEPAGGWAGAYVPPDDGPREALRPPGRLRTPRVVPPLWPVFVSSVVFALAHWGQGPAPVSLFFLAWGLGYLYRQTGRIWPSVVVHVVLNAFSLTVTVLSELIEMPPPS